MFKNLVFLFLVFVMLGCDYFKDDEENFIDAYKSILFVREKYKKDSVRAENEILKIYNKYGFTQQSFKEEFFEIAHEDTRRFYDLLDSIREKVRVDMLKQNIRKFKKDRE